MNCADIFIFKADLSDFNGCKISVKKQAVSDIARKFVINYIGEHEGISTDKLVYSRSIHGKPYIVGSHLHFNISHCGSVIAAAFCAEEIGADIELVRNFNLAVVKRYFTANESDYVTAAPDKNAANRRFFEIWTAKEAFLKYCGVGISGGFDFDTATITAPCDEIKSQKLGEASVIHHNGNILIGHEDIPIKNLCENDGELADYCFSICARKIDKIKLNIL